MSPEPARPLRGPLGGAEEPELPARRAGRELDGLTVGEDVVERAGARPDERDPVVGHGRAGGEVGLVEGLGGVAGARAIEVGLGADGVAAHPLAVHDRGDGLVADSDLEHRVREPAARAGLEPELDRRAAARGHRRRRQPDRGPVGEDARRG